MKIAEIISADNQKLKLVRNLAQFSKKKDTLERNNLILLEGAKLIGEALHKKIKLHDVILSKSFYEDGFVKSKLADYLESALVVKDNLFKDLYTTDTSCGIIATAEYKEYTLYDIISTNKLILLADNIQDPGNIGTIIRTAFAFEAGGVVFSTGSADCYSPKVIRSSMGAIFSLPIIKGANLLHVMSELKKAGFSILALDAKAKESIWHKEVSVKPTAYILGNEGHGLSLAVLDEADDSISIPISAECESLNVAIAAGIILAHNKFVSGN